MQHGLVLVCHLPLADTHGDSVHELLIHKVDVDEAVKGAKVADLSDHEVCLYLVNLIFRKIKVIEDLAVLGVLARLNPFVRPKPLSPNKL